MEICIAVADWARGPMTWVLDVPGGEGTDATPRRRPTHSRNARTCRVSRNDATDVWTVWTVWIARTRRTNAGSTVPGPGAGMVVGWG
ncbi:hypothetical protein GTY92_08230 [Streptomyces sp. SID4950]|nr:hypothetical protein [Streptomyces sp. SID4950]